MVEGARSTMLAAGALVAVVAFRAGFLPGGLVGIDVALALAGWFVGSRWRQAEPSWSTARSVVSYVWPAALATLLLASAWVLVTPSTAWDVVARGEGFAMIGGYGNWHQISLGPLEANGTRLLSPLQHLWAWSALAQAALIWFLVVWVAAVVRLPRRAPEIAVVLAGVLLTWSVALLLVGTDAQRMLLSTEVRSVAFLLGAAAGAGAGPSFAALGRSLLPLLSLALVGLATVAWTPSTVISPVLAGLAVAGAMVHDQERRVLPDIGLLAVFASIWFVHGPALALVGPERLGLPWFACSALGIVLAVAIGIGIELLASALPVSDTAAEWRAVVVPPAFAIAMMVLMLVTGAFAWAPPEPLP